MQKQHIAQQQQLAAEREAFLKVQEETRKRQDEEMAAREAADNAQLAKLQKQAYKYVVLCCMKHSTYSPQSCVQYADLIYCTAVSVTRSKLTVVIMLACTV